MRVSANPGGPGHTWLHERFVKGTSPDYTFIQSLASDNPYLPEGYFDRLEGTMEGISKAHRLYGDWDAIVKTGFFEMPVILKEDPGGETRTRLRVWDLAAGGDNTVGTLIERRRGTDPEFVVLDMFAQQTSAEKVVKLVRDYRDLDGPGTTTIIEQEPGASSLILLESMPFAIGVRADKNKVQRARPVADAVESKRIGIVPGTWRQAFIDELMSFPSSKYDDRVDSFVHGMNYLLNREVQLWGF